MRRIATLLVVIASTALIADYANAQSRRGSGGPGGSNGSADSKKTDKIKPYEDVITEEAKTDPGLFIVHLLDDKIFYEIPADQLNKDMLWVTQIAKTQSGYGYGGTPAGNRVVRWEIRGDNILLRDVKYTIRADVDDSIKTAVESTSVHPIIMTFPIKAWGTDKKPVIDVTKLFTSDVAEFSAKRRLNASGADSSRTFIDEVKSFPENIESKILMTYKPSSGGQSSGRFPGAPRQRRDSSQSGVTVQLHHSMVLLPAKPMQPREHDNRVGFFSVGFEDYGTGEHEVKNIRYITRWRLEKTDPKADVSDPVKPIVFHVGRGVPDKWRPYVKKGIEMWQPVFEAAGFSNAIIAKDAPSAQEDPDWDAEDARYSSIRWLPSTVENAMGPHVHDPRTGEILESDILVYHNVLKLCRDWYFAQASASDERAQKLPMPDELIGDLLAYVIAHEVGHTLGFPHNMKASSSYTVAQLRDPEFTKKNGTEASIMDYGRYNYVAQPGDGATLIPTTGPYDFFVVEWGYGQYKDAEAEKAGLATIVAKQKDDRMLFYGGGNSRQDPTDQTEDLGSDSIEATELGLKNIERIMGFIVDATCNEGENYDLLQNMYNEVLGQRNRELGHVANVVGGFDKLNLWYGDADKVYNTVSPERQSDAVAFINQHAFRVPNYMISDDILLRLEASGTADRILSGQTRLLSTLLSETRIKRMAEQVERAPDNSYSPAKLLSDLRRGIYSEVEETFVNINLYRRNLQRSFADTLMKQVKREGVTTDLPALCRGELENIRTALEEAIKREGDDVTRLHLKDLLVRITRALDDKADSETGVATASTTPPTRPGGGQD